MEEEERRRPRRGDRRFHDSRYNFFRRGQAPPRPHCCRQGRSRTEVDTDVYTVYSPMSREESRERERRRQIRNRIREEEEVQSGERKKKKTAKSKIRRWSNCFCGILIVLGLVFVFYVITTLIIDGSTPLDYFLHEDEKKLPGFEPPVVPTKNGTDKTRNRDNVDTGHSTTTEDTENVIKTVLTKTPEENSTPKTKKSAAETKDKQEDEEVVHEYEGEEEDEYERDTKVRGRKEPSTTQPVIVPVMVMTNSESNREENLFRNINRPAVNRHGEISTDYSAEKEMSNFRRNHRGTYDNHNSGRRLSPSSERDRFQKNRRIPFFHNDHKKKSFPIRSPTIPTIEKPSKMLHTRKRPSHKNVRYNSNIPRTRYTTSRKRNGWHRDTERGPLRYNRASFERFGGVPSESSKYNSNFRSSSSARESSHDRPGYIKQQKFSLYRRYVEKPKRRRLPVRRNRNYRKVPSEFQYPSSADSIQDIIRYMDSRDREIPQHAFNEEINNNKYNAGSDDTHHLSSDIYIGSQDHVIGHDTLEPNNGYSIGEHDHISEDSKHSLPDTNDGGEQYESYPAYTSYNVNDYSSNLNNNNNYHENHKDYNENYGNHNNQYRSSTDDSRPLPPVRNTYDVFSSLAGSRSSHPIRLMLDIYPINDNLFSSSNQMQSVVTTEGIDNRGYKESGGDKKEIVLNLNILSKPRAQSSESTKPAKENVGLSLEIPLDGTLSLLDIYRAVVAQARKGPIASAQTDNERDKLEKSDDKTEFELFDIENGSTLFSALEDGFRKVNRRIPTENKVLISEFP